MRRSARGNAQAYTGGRLDAERGVLDAARMRLCPKCKTPTLAPFGAIRGGGDPDAVPPSRCAYCKGVWLPHEAIEAHLPPDASDSAIAADPRADALPGFWGGYRVEPTRLEFWQGRKNRLHDRFVDSIPRSDGHGIECGSCEEQRAFQSRNLQYA